MEKRQTTGVTLEIFRSWRTPISKRDFATKYGVGGIYDNEKDGDEIILDYKGLSIEMWPEKACFMTIMGIEQPIGTLEEMEAVLFEYGDGEHFNFMPDTLPLPSINGTIEMRGEQCFINGISDEHLGYNFMLTISEEDRQAVIDRWKYDLTAAADNHAEEKITRATQGATDAFWSVVSASFPEINFQKLTPDESHRFEEFARESIKWSIEKSHTK